MLYRGNMGYICSFGRRPCYQDLVKCYIIGAEGTSGRCCAILQCGGGSL